MNHKHDDGSRNAMGEIGNEEGQLLPTIILPYYNHQSQQVLFLHKPLFGEAERRLSRPPSKAR